MKVDNKDNIGRIFNGLQASTNIPWQIRLEIPTPDYEYPSSCSGAILDNITILTIATCVEFAIQNSPEYLVFAGTINKWDQSAQKSQVEKTFIHPEFDDDLLFANIAVLKLKTPLQLEEGVVQPACLPDFNFEPIFGETVVASGWGARQILNGLLDMSKNLQVLNFIYLVVFIV